MGNGKLVEVRLCSGWEANNLLEQERTGDEHWDVVDTHLKGDYDVVFVMGRFVPA